MRNAAPLEIYRLPIIGRSMPEVSTVTSTWRSGAAPTPQPWRDCWAGGFGPASRSAINAREKRPQHSAHRGAERGTFVSTFGFTPHNSVRKDRAMAARANVRTVVSDAQDKGREAVEAVSEVRDNLAVA